MRFKILWLVTTFYVYTILKLRYIVNLKFNKVIWTVITIYKLSGKTDGDAADTKVQARHISIFWYDDTNRLTRFS